jgi:long-chain acyl-CoA synthetase
MRRPEARMFQYFIIDHARKLSARRSSTASRVGCSLAGCSMARRIAGLRPAEEPLGLTRIRVGYTAGEAIGPEIFRFYRSLGINLKQLYGQTEASVYITMQPDGEIRADTVGGRRRASRSGSPTTARCSTARPACSSATTRTRRRPPRPRRRTASCARATPASSTRRPPQDHRPRQGRRQARDGALFAPKYIENKLKFFPTSRRRGLRPRARLRTCFINIDLTAVGNWAERNNVAYASYQELAGHPRSTT